MIFPNGRLSFVNDGWTWKWSKEKVEWGIKNKFIEQEGEGEEVMGENPIGEGGNNIGRWTAAEHAKFLEGYRLYGKDWRRISTIVCV